MIYMLILILLAVIYKAFELSGIKEGTVKVILLYVIFAFAYYIGIHLEMAIKGTSVGAYSTIIIERTRIIIVALGILSIAGFCGGYLLSGFTFNVNERQIRLTDVPAISVIVLIISSGVLLFGFFYDSIISSTSSYSGNFTETYNNSVYAYLKEAFTYSLAAIIALLSTGGKIRKVIALIPTIILVIFGMLSSDKDPILLAMLGWGILFFRWFVDPRINKIRNYFILFIAGILFIPFLSLLFSMYRADATEQTWEQVEKNGLYTYFDASGPLESLIETVEDPNIEFEYGKTYYWGFVSWIPKSVWPGRPVDLATSYAMENIKNWQPGMGLGYSLMAEAYKNFGVTGALLQYFFIGLLAGFLGRLIIKIIRNKIEAQYIFFIWLAYNMAIMHRGPFNLPSSFIRYFLPFLCCYFGVMALFFIYNKIKGKSE